MTKPLVIVESPAKARTIAGFLGDGYVVESSIGHIRDLPRNAREIPAAYKGEPWSRLAVDVDNDFKPIYVVASEKKDQVRKLKAALKGASELYLATDEDREGESIAWHLTEVLNPRVPVKRMVFHEITHGAIEEAIAHPRELDRKLVDAQEARRILDRLVGWRVSEVLWKKVMPRLSAGRVQSVATRLVVERERARMAFRTGEYWDLEGVFAAEGGTFKATLVSVDGHRLATGKDFDAATGHLPEGSPLVQLAEDAARGLAARLTDRPFRVASVETKDWKQSPYAPFMTSTLQQEAGRKLRFSSARTMSVAQRLYERGYITYMRTDSTNLSEQAVGAARAQIRELYGDDYLPGQARVYTRKVKNAQEAHEAIRPAGDRIRTPDQVGRELDGDEARLYELIWKRTIACQMTDARGKRVSLRLAAATVEGEETVFAASGRTISFPGFLRAYVEGSDDPDAELGDREVDLPPVSGGDVVACEGLVAQGHTTQPPARYTEASLVKELEARGIGRPSTYASVIQTIQDRGYVWKKGTALVPSWTAMAVVRLLEGFFDELVDYDFTARMEEDLDDIANGEREAVPWLRTFYFGNGRPGLDDLAAGPRLEEIDARAVNTIPIGTDVDSGEIAVRVGRYGPYLQRGDDTAPVPTDLVPDELTVELATELLAQGKDAGRVVGTDPDTGLDVVARAGRFGPYVQLGELDPDSKTKPKTASLFKSMSLDTVSIEDALRLLSLPRVVGEETDDKGEVVQVTAQNGRYGPYLKKGTDSRSLETEDQLFTVTMDEARAIFAQPKRRGARQQKVLADLGPHPDSEAPVRILDGRYGPYATDGTTNASLPRGTDPEACTLDEAIALLRAREAAGPAKKRRAPAKKKTAAKGTTKKTAARTTAKKSGRKPPA